MCSALRQVERYQRAQRWLDPLSPQPSFGIAFSSQNTVYSEIQRAFRRVASSQLFTPLPAQRASLDTLHGPLRAPSAGAEFVLVEARQLKQVARLEEVLRTEAAQLNSQCSLYVLEAALLLCLIDALAGCSPRHRPARASHCRTSAWPCTMCVRERCGNALCCCGSCA
jgi:hypothetical protein